MSISSVVITIARATTLLVSHSLRSSCRAAHLLRRDVHFNNDNNYAILSLRGSKADTNFTGVEIVLAAEAGSPSCPFHALRNLFELDPQSSDSPVFRLHNGAFTRSKYVDNIRSRLRIIGTRDAHKYAGIRSLQNIVEHAIETISCIPSCNVQPLLLHIQKLISSPLARSISTSLRTNICSPTGSSPSRLFSYAILAKCCPELLPSKSLS